MRIYAPALLLLVFVTVACNSVGPTPTVSSVEVIPTLLPSPTVMPSPETSPTAQLVIHMITPTTAPTLPPEPTAAPPSATVPVSPDVSPTPTSPPSLSNTAADAALVGILQRCWQVSDPRQMNGNNPAHRDAFDCGRTALITLATNNPAYALVHRVLAWGYFYKDNDVSRSVQEYRAASDLYHTAGDAVGESESRMRLGLLLVVTSLSQACSQFSLAGHLNPQNERASQYYQAYACASAGSSPAAGGKPAPPPPAPLPIDLAQIRGKIVFKSDRAGAESYYVMDADGRNVKEISASTYNAAGQYESWSPDRTRVATVRYVGSNRKFGYDNDIWITDPTGGSGRGLENPANDYDPAWSPVGLFDGLNWLAFVSNRGDLSHPDNQGDELWVMHPDSTSSFRLTCHGPLFSKHPSWSGDGSQIVMYSNWPGGGNSQIFVIDATVIGSASDKCQVGETLKNISNNGFNDSEPVWVK